MQEKTRGLLSRRRRIASTMKEQINHIRGWAFERAIRAAPQPIRR
jgi:hypothetical protein